MAEKFTSYLSELKFDPKLWNTLQAKYITNFRLVALLILSIVIMGIYNYMIIPRRVNPEIKIPIITIITVLPGASPNDVESLISIPLEEKLNGMKGLDTMTSSSQENVSAISMQFVSGIDPEKARSDVQAIVDTVKLPEDTTDPTVTAIDFEDQPIWTFAVITNEDYVSLMRFSQVLKDKIDNVQKVDRVVTNGFNEQEVQVVIDPTKVKEYNINPLLLSQAISRAASSYPAGSIKTDTSVIALSIDPDVTTIDDIRNIRISTNGQIVTLGDIATVVEHSKPEQATTFLATKNDKATPAVQFYVYKTSSANIDAAEHDVKKIVEETVAQYNNRFRVVSILNTAEQITDQFGELFSEFQSTIILVFINLLLFLGLRQAFISSLTIPLTFFSSIAILNMVGMSLNFLTSFAFLIALGLLIDDTIVTVAAMTRYYATKKFTGAETGLLVWRDFIVPLWSTTITTVWAFVPLLLSSGIIGEFIKPIPVVVTTTMLSSTSIAVLITLPLMTVILNPSIPSRVKKMFQILGFVLLLLAGFLIIPKTQIFIINYLLFILVMILLYKIRKQLIFKFNQLRESNKTIKSISHRASNIIDHGVINTEKLSHKYMGVVNTILSSRSLRRKTLGVLVIFALVSYLLIPLGFVKNEFFPKTDENTVYVSLEMPAGTNVNITNFESRQIIENLRKTPELLYVTAETGRGIGAMGNSSAGGNSVLFTLRLTEPADREITSLEIGDQLREQFKTYTKGTISVTELSGGPPAGSDIQIKILGDNLSVLDNNAEKLVEFLKKEPGVTNVQKSIKSGTSKLVFVPNKTKLAENNVTVDSLGLWLRTAASGFTLDSIKFDEEDDTDVVFRMNINSMTPEELSAIMIPTQTGPSIPLVSLGEFKLETNPTVITREKGKRTISVSAGVIAGTSPIEKNQKLLDYANTLDLPAGYTLETGGVNEENEKSVQSIMQAMGLSFLLILITMIIEFNSFRQALMVLLVIPLAIPGVFYVFGLTGTPLSFPALIGMLALFGIVVTNAIVVIEKINDNRREGMPLKEAIVDASGSRLEPILLTSITSILGLLPITLSNPVWRGLGGAIISGLLFSGLVKLFFVPVIYYMWYAGDEKEKTQEKKS